MLTDGILTLNGINSAVSNGRSSSCTYARGHLKIVAVLRILMGSTAMYNTHESVKCSDDFAPTQHRMHPWPLCRWIRRVQRIIIDCVRVESGV